MNHRQRRFAAEYLIDADRAAAAVRAGYRPRRAAQQGCLLMRNAEVGYAIALAQRARSRRTGVTRERVLLELARIAFADLGRLVEWSGTGAAVKDLAALGDDEAAAIAELKSGGGEGRRVALGLYDKGAALELLARQCGLYDGDAGARAPTGRARLMARLRPYREDAPP